LLVIAHRGASAERPENTLAAFERAIHVGADYVELDVHADRTGRLVVTHDRPKPGREYPTLEAALELMHGRIGVMPGGGITVLLAQSVGLRKAIELSLTGNFLSAADALALGLVNHVLPHEELLPFARRVAADIAGNDQAAVRRLLAHYRRLAGAATLDEAHLLEGMMAETWQPGTSLVAGRRAAIFRRFSRLSGSKRSILFQTSRMRMPASGSMPNWRSTVSTSRCCASVSSCEMSRTWRMTSASSTSSSVARNAATSWVGRLEMKPTVSDSIALPPCGKLSARNVGSSVANSMSAA